MHYAIPSQVLVAHLEDEAVLLHMDTKRYYRLNETASRIWKGLEQDEDMTAIVQTLCERFAVAADTARAEVLDIVHDLLNCGLLTSSRP
jgi:hypothetical protein